MKMAPRTEHLFADVVLEFRHALPGVLIARNEIRMRIAGPVESRRKGIEPRGLQGAACVRGDFVQWRSVFFGIQHLHAQTAHGI